MIQCTEPATPAVIACVFRYRRPF